MKISKYNTPLGRSGSPAEQRTCRVEARFVMFFFFFFLLAFIYLFLAGNASVCISPSPPVTPYDIRAADKP